MMNRTKFLAAIAASPLIFLMEDQPKTSDKSNSNWPIMPNNTVALYVNLDGKHYGLGFRLEDAPDKATRRRSLKDLSEAAEELFHFKGID